ncbi:MAG: phosphoribosylformylglycinamidine cyclo-ligase [Thermaerobacter sp.]|nr:phosphoribosylformylglycinamidine cyclo-ligase [Thermaerobacter sp.]
MSDAYRASGVDLDAKERLVGLLKAVGAKATRDEVMDGIGGFGGLFRLQGYRDPVLVAGADGVGTKLLVAQEVGRMDGVGQDVVAMVANDVLCQGAEMLFFLDYVGVGRLIPEEVATVVSGVARACSEIGAALLGGETAELPDLFPTGALDLVGFGVGAVERDRVLRGSDAVPGDILIGLPSDGVHSNGFSLVRRILREQGLSLAQRHGLDAPLGEALLRPTHLYGPEVLPALQGGAVRGISHITGGGIVGNLPRMLPEGCGARLDRTAWAVPPELALLLEVGSIEPDQAARIFNMGLGLVLAVQPAAVDKTLAAVRGAGGKPRVVGEVVRGEGVQL